MPIKDIPALLADRLLTFYQNGLKQIVPTQGQAPAGKISHGTFEDNFILSAINRVTDYRLLNLRLYFNTLRSYDDGETTVGADYVVYLNVSGGTLLGVNPTTPGNSGTAGEPWRPITSGPPPAFGIPLWNTDGLVTDGVGNPITNGTGVYADKELVRADNGIYQRNLGTTPPPVSTNFLDECNQGYWIHLPDLIPLYDLAEFISRRDNQQLTPGRYYVVTNADSAVNNKTIIIQATAKDNYDRNCVLLADYTGASSIGTPRGTVEYENIKYDVDLDKLLERQDNHGTFARQTSDSVNSGPASNAVDRAPWGILEAENNNFDNVYFTNPYTQVITSYKNNNLKNAIVNHTQTALGYDFNNNICDSGNITLTNIVLTANNNKAINGGLVSANSADVSNATADGVSCIASATGATARGTSCGASGLNSFASGIACTASAAQSIAMGFTCSATAVGAVAIGYNCTCSGIGGFSTGSSANVIGAGGGSSSGSGGQVTGTYGNITGHNCYARGELTRAKGKFADTDINNADAVGWTDPAASGIGGAVLQYLDIPIGLRTTNATPGNLITVNVTGGDLIVPNQYTWSFELDLTATCAVGPTRATWKVFGELWNNSGAITLLGSLLFMDATGAITNVNAVRYATIGFAPSIAFPVVTANKMTIEVTGTVNPINWMGVLRVVQNKAV